MMFQALVWLMCVAPAFKWWVRVIAAVAEPKTISSHGKEPWRRERAWSLRGREEPTARKARAD